MTKELQIALEKCLASKKEREAFRPEFDKYNNRMRELTAQWRADWAEFNALMLHPTDELSADAGAAVAAEIGK